jgi:PAS domain S-box-containing protein
VKAATTPMAISSDTSSGAEGNLLRLLIDSVQDYAIFALDQKGNVLTWNPGAERLKGYAADEITGRHFSAFYTEEDLTAGKPARLLQVAAAAGKAEDEGWRVRKDGTRFWANVLITALRDDAGVLVGFAKVTRDLTVRRAAEEMMRESEERFRLLVQSVEDYAIFMLDPTGRVTTWNAGAERIKGYTAEEITGQHFSVFYTAEDLAAGKPARELVTAVETGHYEEEGWRVRKDGTRFWANVVLTPIHRDSGGIAGFAKVTRDLTQRRAADERALMDAQRIAAEEGARAAAEERAHELRSLTDQLRAQTAELERRTAEAEAGNRSKSDFLAAMSHELRTPLNAIAGYTELMQAGVSGPLTEAQHDQLNRIQRSQRHLLGIINDILNFSRIEAGKVAYVMGPIVLQALVSDVATMIQPQADKKRLRLTLTRCSPALMARADRAKVEQILLNLLSNAVKFTDEGGEITIVCGAGPDNVWLSVSDTGIGIPEGQQESIFAPFTQVGRSLASPMEGTGLGLAISRDLARAMRGDLTVESTEGTGSTFTLSLPSATSRGA